MREDQKMFSNNNKNSDENRSDLSLKNIPFTEQYVDEAVNIYKDIFINDEQATRTSAPDPQRFNIFAEPYANFLIKKHLSFLTQDQRTHSIIGFIFCLDLIETAESAGEWMTLLDEDYPELMTMIEELEKRHIDPVRISSGTVLHIFQIGVERKYRHHGVAQELINRVLDNAGKLGYQKVLADCTSESSYKLFKKSGFKEVGFSSYKEFTFNGNRFFSELNGGIYLMERLL